jgi:PadR family transcriptional regulator, regulatory protein PadR
MKELTILEQIILVSIINLREEAYGMAIRQKIKAAMGKSLMYGTLYNALDQLYRKGFIQKVKHAPSETEGARGRVYYSLTNGGRKALKAAYKLQQTIWGSVPEFFKEEGQ